MTRFNGKVWAGDGGICAFYLGNHSQDAVECSLAIHLTMHLFNLDRQRNRFHEPVAIRVAAHEGQAAYKQGKGSIFSEAINFVAHMEKRATDSGGLSISERVHGLIDPRLQRIFQPRGCSRTSMFTQHSSVFPGWTLTRRRHLPHRAARGPQPGEPARTAP